MGARLAGATIGVNLATSKLDHTWPCHYKNLLLVSFQQKLAAVQWSFEVGANNFGRDTSETTS
jgi:hypothetical protein